MRRKLAAGNWKMHGLKGDLETIKTISQSAAGRRVDCLLGLPATLISSASALGLFVSGQDCHPEPKGAFTGDISAAMLYDAGARFVILGHSERRGLHKESNALIAAKVQAAWAAGLTAILCIGESEAEYRAGKTLDVLAAQIAGSLPEGAAPETTIIAYEPVWAIGTGLTPTPEEIAHTHAFIRGRLPDAGLSILYGGSVSPSNAATIFALEDVDGGLVGGASLKAETFIPIIDALEATT